MKGAEAEPLYQSSASVTFSATHSLRGIEGPEARHHGHDYTATFLFEAASLIYPGVVIDDDMRDEIARHVRDRFAYRDLDRVLTQPATCEAIAENLARWYVHSARPVRHARLISVTVSTSSGMNGSIRLPPPASSGWRRGR
jgi:6-pyruvoyl-tetrahydropterin synthase